MRGAWSMVRGSGFVVGTLSVQLLLVLGQSFLNFTWSEDTLKCLRIGTPKIINFPFVSNGELMFLGVPIIKHIVMRLYSA